MGHASSRSKRMSRAPAAAIVIHAAFPPDRRGAAPWGEAGEVTMMSGVRRLYENGRLHGLRVSPPVYKSSQLTVHSTGSNFTSTGKAHDGLQQRTTRCYTSLGVYVSLGAGGSTGIGVMHLCLISNMTLCPLNPRSQNPENPHPSSVTRTERVSFYLRGRRSPDKDPLRALI